MLISKSQIPLPRRTLLYDLALRSGSPNTESLSPYNGLHAEVMKQFPRQAAPVMRMIESPSYRDFDPDAITPQSGPYRQIGRTDVYLERLEDIEVSWVRQYLVNVLVGIKSNAKGGLREYEYTHPSARSYVDEEGRVLNESDTLLENEDDYSARDIAQAKEKIPYILKRLHARSKVTRIHLISLIIAYEKAKKLSGSKGPTITSIAEHGVYFMRADGNVGPNVIPSDNKNGPFKEIAGWILGYKDKIDSYFDNMLELLNICDILKIDITNENPLDYQEDFINSLTADYIAKNKAYIYNKRTGVNPDVYNALKGITLDDYDMKPGEEVRNKSFIELYPDTMQMFLDAELAYVDKTEVREHDLAVFFTHYNQIIGGAIQLDKLVAKDGFLYINNSMPVMMPVDRFCREGIGSKVALFHISGYAVLITDTNDFYFQDVNILTRYLQSIYDKTTETDTYGNNTKFGTWKEAMV